MEKFSLVELRYLLGLVVDQLPNELLENENGNIACVGDVDKVQILFKIVSLLHSKIELPF